MKVSVVIPTFNRPEMLRKAIASVVAQSACSFEIIVVQNGQSDVSRPVSEEFLKKGVRVRHYHLSKPCAVMARNYGVQQALGEYVAFLDDDDTWDHHKLARQVDFLDTNARYDLVACRVNVIDPQKLGYSGASEFSGAVRFKDLIVKGCVIHSLSTVLVRRRALAYEPFNPAFKSSNDYDFYFRMAARKTLWIMPDRLVNYLWHSNNQTQNLILKFDENLRVMRRAAKEPSLNSYCRTLARIYLFKRGLIYGNAGSDCVDRRDWAQALLFLTAAFVRDPFWGLKLRWCRKQSACKRLLRSLAVWVSALTMVILNMGSHLLDRIKSAKMLPWRHQ